MKISFRIGCILSLYIALGLSICLKSHGQVDPQIKWKKVQLPHFDLIYDANHQELAKAYASELESIVQTLGQVFTHIPEKTLIILNDRTDLTNGYATPIPTSTIMIFPVLPGPLESIYEHGNWPRELVMHEYTHILSFEPRRGVVKVLKNIFGSIVTPNILLPRWWLEGVAVEMETRFSNSGSGFGRLRSLGQDASLRSFVIENQKIDLGMINETGIPSWPWGARPYLFGSLMWSYMIDKKQVTIVDNLHIRYGGRFPYLLEVPIEDEFQKNYTQIFDEMMTDLRIRVDKQMKVLAQVPFHSSRKFVTSAAEALSPVISPDELKLAYLVKDDTGKRSIRILQRPDRSSLFSEAQQLGKVTQRLTEQSDTLKTIPGRIQEEPDGPPTGTISRVSWYSKENSFLFDKVSEINAFHESSDLWKFDLNTMKAVSLTKGLRAREGALSPDDKKIVYVQLGPGTTEIALLNNETQQSYALYRPEMLATVSFPTFLNSNIIVFTEKAKNGTERLLKIHLDSQNKATETTQILSDYDNPRLATLSSIGLIFQSSKNKVPNLYLASNDLRSARPLTHTQTSTSTATWDSGLQELYFTELSSTGNTLRILSEGEISRIGKTSLPAVHGLFEDRYRSPAKTMTNDSSQFRFQESDYSPAPYLWPQYWLPGLYVGSTSASLSATTGGSDPVGLHSYSLSAGYDTKTTDFNYNFIYINQVWTPTFLFGALDYKTSVYLTGFELRKKMQSFASHYQLSSISTDLTAKAGWDWRTNEFTNSLKTYSTGPTFGLQYANYTQSGAQISPESGQGFSLANTSFLRDSNKEGFNELRFSAVQFFSKWLPSHHALMLRIQGQWIDEKVSLGHYSPTSAFLTSNNPLFPQYLMRGYPTGQFLAKSLANYTAEYRFPIAKTYRGAGTTPLFIKQLHGAIVADGIQADGFYLVDKQKDISSFPFERTEKWRISTDAGAELKADITLGYHFPLTIYMGVYWPLDTIYSSPSPQYGLGLQL